MKSLSEKVIVIMGASSGIGAATARLLARKGAKLVTVARSTRTFNCYKKKNFLKQRFSCNKQM